MAEQGLNAASVGIPGAGLGWTLGVILRTWHEQVEAAVSGLPHGPRGYQILSVVGHSDPPTQAQLARHLNIDKTVLPYIIDALVDDGVVERLRDPADGRVRRIAITEHGRTVLAELEAKVRAAEDTVLGRLPGTAREAFVANASRLAMMIHAAHPTVDPCLELLDAVGGE